MMKVGTVVGRSASTLIALLAGCSFSPHGAAPSDAPASDSHADGRSIDAAVDAAHGLQRVTTGLIALWTFDEGSGTIAHDTANAGSPIDLTLTKGSAAWGAGSLAITAPTELASTDTHPHIDADCNQAHACTLEMWVQAGSDDQTGTSDLPVLVGGLSANAASFNIALLQSGTTWVSRVRTTTGDGKPDLVATTPVTTQLTHVVITADATGRTIYVDAQPAGTDNPGTPTGWNTYPMLLGDETSQNVPWTGSYALVALYSRALSADEVMTNFEVGP